MRDRRDRAAETEPVAGRNVALGDRDEAREPRLGGEKIVATRVEGAVGHPIADRQQLARRDRAESRSPFRAPSPARSLRGREARRQSGGRVRRLADVAPMALDRRGVPPPSRTACPRQCRRLVRSRTRTRYRPWSRPAQRDPSDAPRCPRSGPADRTPAASAASVSSSCCHVTVWVRRPSRNWSVASRARSSASAMPARRCAAVGARTVHSRQALASAIRWPARFPLSTVETYGGSSGRRSRVSYQL